MFSTQVLTTYKLLLMCTDRLVGGRRGTDCTDRSDLGLAPITFNLGRTSTTEDVIVFEALRGQFVLEPREADERPDPSM